MTVLESLTAAKALIDTPEKYAALGSYWNALYRATSNFNEYYAADMALDKWRDHDASGHAALMLRFDRAIAASEPRP